MQLNITSEMTRQDIFRRFDNFGLKLTSESVSNVSHFLVIFFDWIKLDKEFELF